MQGIKKFEEVLKLYPNSFEANFEMGYFYLKRITRIEGSNAEIDKSINCLETANKLKPNSPATLSNLAIAYNFRKRYEDSVLSAYKAAQIDDNQEIVQNLFNSLTQAPPGMLKNNPKVAPIVADARLLISKRGISGERWVYVRPRMIDPKDDDNSPGGMARRGIVGSGTGFFISDDGYIMTNRHVAAGGDKMIVRLADGTQKVAEKVVVDDEQDIAILKIKGDVKTPFTFIKIADYETPEVGTDVTVMGFPLGAMFGTNVKITRGVVTSIEADRQSPCDVIVDAQVNPGNSGGPMLDKHGNLMALVAMKTLSDESISSYGLGISTSRLRKFFEHQKDKLTSIKLVKADKVDDATTPLSTEQIAKKFTKATVMILIVSGDLPEGLK
ncbi:MAG: trypsin-like peptidase domain-containing protein [Tepidisphaeraceae bacterium]